MSVQMLPNSVQRYLQRAAIATSETLLLSFDETWRLVGTHGTLSRFDLHQQSSGEISELFHSLCIGLPRLKGAELKQVGLPNGKFVDLHLFTGPSAVHVLLLDVRDTVEQTRVWQQSAQETELKSYEKTRQLRRQKSSVAELRLEVGRLRWALELERAKTSQLRHELFVDRNGSVEDFADAFLRHQGITLSQRTEQCQLSDVANALGQLLAGQIVVKVRTSGDRVLMTSARALASALLPALMFAHRRAAVTQPSLQAELSEDANVVKLVATAGHHDLTDAESGVLWSQTLPERDLTPPEQALLLLSERLRETEGRATRSFSPELGLQITVSVPVLQTKLLSQTLQTKPQRSVLGKQLWLICQHEANSQSLSGELGVIVEIAMQQSGVTVSHLQSYADCTERLKNGVPEWVVLDLRLPDAAKFGFTLKSSGARLRLIGVGELKGGAAVKSAFDLVVNGLSAEHLRSAILG